MAFSLSMLLCIAALWPRAASAEHASRGPIVVVDGGALRGRLGEQGASFLGIPYAAPPLRERRWREPGPVEPWQGIRDAAVLGASCLQNPNASSGTEVRHLSEDCLYLNVWTPVAPPLHEKLPVMFWLHGGSNTAGGAAASHLDGAALSRRGVVVVSINYRLGVFGFLAHPALSAESPHHASGDYGLLDQLAALRWVRRNIAGFGGDPGNVTVFGQSAGSVDIGMLLVSPLSRGLFQRAIEESGPAVRPMTSLEQAQAEGVTLLENLQLPGGAAGIARLRLVPAAEVQRAGSAFRRPGEAALTIQDGWVIPDDPGRLYARGAAARVPLLFGTNAQEIRGVPRNDVPAFIAANFGDETAAALRYYDVADGAPTTPDPLFGTLADQVSGDVRHRCPMLQQALWYSDHAPVYEYQFDLPVAGEAAPRHSAEVPFVFGNLLPGGPLGGPYDDADRQTSDLLQRYWTQFARTGDPNGPGLPPWPRFDAAARSYLEFTRAGSVVRAGLRREICTLYSRNLAHQFSTDRRLRNP